MLSLAWSAPEASADTREDAIQRLTAAERLVATDSKQAPETPRTTLDAARESFAKAATVLEASAAPDVTEAADHLVAGEIAAAQARGALSPETQRAIAEADSALADYDAAVGTEPFIRPQLECTNTRFAPVSAPSAVTDVTWSAQRTAGVAGAAVDPYAEAAEANIDAAIDGAYELERTLRSGAFDGPTAGGIPDLETEACGEPQQGSMEVSTPGDDSNARATIADPVCRATIDPPYKIQVDNGSERLASVSTMYCTFTNYLRAATTRRQFTLCIQVLDDPFARRPVWEMAPGGCTRKRSYTSLFTMYIETRARCFRRSRIYRSWGKITLRRDGLTGIERATSPSIAAGNCMP